MNKEIDLSGVNLIIGIPTLREIPLDLWQALLETKEELKKYGAKCAYFFKPGCSLLDKARNEIIMGFLRQKEATHLLCVDDDVIFTPADATKVLAHSIWNDKKIIAGPYPVKSIEADFRYPLVLDENNCVVSDESGLIQVQHAPAGFMMLSREILHTMIGALPRELFYMDNLGEFANEWVPCLFESKVVDYKYLGEDVLFCRRAADAGITTWLDPSINLIHRGSYDFNHDFATWARKTYEIVETHK